MAPFTMTMRFLLAVALTCSASFAQQSATPTFSQDIAPFVYANCTRCHRPGEAGPFPLITFRDVKKRADNLLAVMEDRFMPPWHPAPGFGEFRNELRLGDAQIDMFRAWMDAEKPEGPPGAMPKGLKSPSLPTEPWQP